MNLKESSWIGAEHEAQLDLNRRITSLYQSYSNLAQQLWQSSNLDLSTRADITGSKILSLSCFNRTFKNFVIDPSLFAIFPRIARARRTIGGTFELPVGLGFGTTLLNFCLRRCQSQNSKVSIPTREYPNRNTHPNFQSKEKPSTKPIFYPGSGSAETFNYKPRRREKL